MSPETKTTDSEASFDASLPACYPDSISPQLRRAIAHARLHLDTFTWMEMLKMEIDVTNFVTSQSAISDEVVWFTQATEQILPWEPGALVVKASLQYPVSAPHGSGEEFV